MEVKVAIKLDRDLERIDRETGVAVAEAGALGAVIVSLSGNAFRLCIQSVDGQPQVAQLHTWKGDFLEPKVRLLLPPKESAQLHLSKLKPPYFWKGPLARPFQSKPVFC